MKKLPSLLLFFLLLFMAVAGMAQVPYKNPALPVAARVRDLLKRMTPEEKFWQLFMIPGDLGKDPSLYKNGIFGFQLSAASAGTGASEQLLQYNTSDDAVRLAEKANSIQAYMVNKTRLGIPAIFFDETLHGLVRGGATAFPQAIALAATFDTALMAKVAAAIAKETRLRGIRQSLSPVVNIASDVRWGRTEETYGEDPFLSSAMAVAYVNAFEKAGVIATPKHFIANVGDGGRDSYPIHFNERLLDEIYFPPFTAAFRKGGARSVMTSYNSIDGSPATASNWLLNKKLKKEWGFTGFVISDASAVGGANVLHFTAKDYAAAGRNAIINGLDVIFQTDYAHHKLFIQPFLDGTIPVQRINDAVSRVLRAKFELGLFDQPYTDVKDIQKELDLQEHRKLAKKAALQSIVLLKNENAVLPFKKGIKRLAVIGSDAKEARLGGYAGPGNSPVSLLEGLQKKMGAATEILFSEGCGRKLETTVAVPVTQLFTNAAGAIVPGLTASYFAANGFTGKPVLTHVENGVNGHWTLYPPLSSLTNDEYAVRWTGQFKAIAGGTYQIGLEGNDGFRLYLNGKMLIDQWRKVSFHTITVPYNFEKDTLYDIVIEFHESQGNGQIRLITDMDMHDAAQEKIDAAVQTAAQADLILVAAGIEEGEFRDRASLALPGKQEEMIRQLAATGKPVVVLLYGGSAVIMEQWINQVQGIAAVWYPGEAGGDAVADILTGDANPAGRLPITYPLSEAQLPLVYNHKPTGRGDDYLNLSGQPLFPFGFGLSYTNFTYQSIRLEKSVIGVKDSVRVYVTVTNTGSRDGDEVVQLYIRDIIASIARPVQELKGFKRVHISAGQTKEIVFTITPAELEMLDENLKRKVEPGDFRIMAGSSSRDLWLKTTLHVVGK
jgi:beta-glucosidase